MKLTLSPCLATRPSPREASSATSADWGIASTFSDADLLGDLDRVIDLNADVADRALARSVIPSPSGDEHRLRAAPRVCGDELAPIPRQALRAHRQQEFDCLVMFRLLYLRDKSRCANLSD
jgi:hypothetical protein